MVGKIDSNPLNTARRIDTPGKPVAAATDSGQAASAPSGPVSGVQTLLSRALDQARQAPDIQQERVDALKAAISRGEFQIDARAVAQALLAMEDGA